MGLRSLWRRLPADYRTFSSRDLRAGLVHGLVSVPDGLAAGLLAGLSPLAGLYGYLFGTITGALATSSVVMSVQATGAMAVILSDVPGLTGPGGTTALATLTILTGALMLAAGIARLGTLVRYVPNAVLTGFVNAVAANIVLAQLADATGYHSDAANRILRAGDTILNVASFHWPTVAVAVGTAILIVVLERTRLGALGLAVAIVAASVVTALLPSAGVQTLNDITEVPRSLPGLVLPSLGLIAALVVPAASLAFVGLVQGAAISQSQPNPDGSYPNPSRDFSGQGIANLVSGVFQGMPVGGSMSATALVVAAGGRGRASNLVAGLVMIVTILLFGSAAGHIAMPALAALLIVIGIRTFKIDQAVMVWRTGGTQAVIMAATFVLALLVPMQYAVLYGVAISVILFVFHQSNRVRVVRWTLDAEDRPVAETDPPATLHAGEIVVLTPYGSLFFASSDVFADQLPAPDTDSAGSVVVIRLRGKEDLGSTFIRMIVGYRDSLTSAGAHLVLTGVGDRVLAQLRNTGTLASLGESNVFPADPQLGASLHAGLRRARDLQNAHPSQ
ncbi:MAG TPA: SulP family inorganic anion transporter [Arachnia sp.]|nr:SulP family inorganic anion transporter [Arachnia sp.]HMT86505.1 SulP family inorganic anion transporter [Arachnia sp.]